MYEGSLYEPPRDFNAANMYFNTNVLAENGFEVPGEEWTKDDFVEIARGTTKKDDSTAIPKSSAMPGPTVSGEAGCPGYL